MSGRILSPTGHYYGNGIRSGDRDCWYRIDHQGSVTNIVDSSDTVAKSYTYDAYGNTSTTGTFINSFAYTGAVIDPETGLYYMNARYYEPGTGRFISEDTYRGDGEGFWNLYLYCNGDPVNETDRTGNKSDTGGGGSKKQIVINIQRRSTHVISKYSTVTVKGGTARITPYNLYLKVGYTEKVNIYGTYYFCPNDASSIRSGSVGATTLISGLVGLAIGKGPGAAIGLIGGFIGGLIVERIIANKCDPYTTELSGSFNITHTWLF